MAILDKLKNKVIVEAGDTLSEIAQAFLGSGSKKTYTTLAALNNIKNPDLIYVGQEISLNKTSGTSTPKYTSSSSGTCTITHFGLQANTDNTIFATWDWSRSNTDSYQVKWEYYTGGIWFVGNSGSNSVDEEDPDSAKFSTYNMPDNAEQVRFKVKPVAKKHRVNDSEVAYWTASWSATKTFNAKDLPLPAPSAPSITLKDYQLTVSLSNIDEDAKEVKFEIVKDDKSVFNTGTATVSTQSASYSCKVSAGGAKYKVRAALGRDKKFGAWSDYSSNVTTPPSAPKSITELRATSETSIYIAWSAVTGADTYEIQYATKQSYLDGSDQVSSQAGIETAYFEKSGLESGEEYFFRVRAASDDGNESAWSPVKSIILGKEPAAPTTWSSTTTAIVGDPLNLYWVHNAEDNSSQTKAELELYVDGTKSIITVENNRSEEDKDKTSVYEFSTSGYDEGTVLEWRVRTAGITNEYGDWSVQRKVDIYAPPTIDLEVLDNNQNDLSVLTTFPFRIIATTSPDSQTPITYNVSVVSKDIYETVDKVGNVVTINVNDVVFSRQFDQAEDLYFTFSASNIDLENGINYELVCTVAMNSGLIAEARREFSVEWEESFFDLDAEIGVDPETLAATIRPYCVNTRQTIHKVVYDSLYVMYRLTDEVIDGYVWGTVIKGAKTPTGELVYSGVTDLGEDILYAYVDETTSVGGVSLAVYRREFDGSFVEISSELDSLANTYVRDPHPSLDLARYRIVGIANDTGAVSYRDLPGYPVNGKEIIIQWEEDWSTFDVANDDELSEPAWAGSMLKLPYNIDVSDSYSPEVSLVNYIGREHPVSYYGTHIGSSSSWSTEIPKTDKETLYALRRLATWMGDVYVREPSGSGYWAQVTVGFSQTHLETVIPVSLNVTRVAGGI